MPLRTNGRGARLPERSAEFGPIERDFGAETSPAVHVFEVADTLVVRMYLADGPVELRVPKSAVKPPARHCHIEGINPDATPC